MTNEPSETDMLFGNKDKDLEEEKLSLLNLRLNRGSVRLTRSWISSLDHG